MRYTEASFEEIRKDPLSTAALAAHNCYQVEKSGDAEAFLTRLQGFKHYSVFEFARYASEIEPELYAELKETASPYVALAGEKYASFSLRPLLEDGKKYSSLIDLVGKEASFLFPEHVYGEKKGRILSEEEISVLPDPVYRKMKFVVLKLVTDRGVTHELVRHRLCSFAQESTRYCNYSKDKFGNEITLIRPLDYEEHKELYDKSFKEAEENYFALLKEGATPEMARAVLPNKLKAAIYMGTDIEEYEHIFALRTSNRAHPDIRSLFEPIREQFRKEGYLR